MAPAAIETHRAKINLKNHPRRKKKLLHEEGAIGSLQTSKKNNPTVQIKVVVTTGQEISVDMKTMIRVIRGAGEGEEEDEEGVGQDTRDIRDSKITRGGSPATTQRARTKRETISSTAPKDSKTMSRSSLGAATETIITGHLTITEETRIITGSTITEIATGHTITTAIGTTTTITKVTIIAIGTITEITTETVRSTRTATINGVEAITIIDSPTSAKKHMSRQKQ